jgi:hypothetical protein
MPSAPERMWEIQDREGKRTVVKFRLTEVIVVVTGIVEKKEMMFIPLPKILRPAISRTVFPMIL